MAAFLKALDPMQQAFQEGHHALLDLVPESIQLPVQGLAFAGFASGLVQLALEAFEFVAEPIQPLPKAAPNITLFAVAFVAGCAAARAVGLIPNSA